MPSGVLTFVCTMAFKIKFSATRCPKVLEVIFKRTPVFFCFTLFCYKRYFKSTRDEDFLNELFHFFPFKVRTCFIRSWLFERKHSMIYKKFLIYLSSTLQNISAFRNFYKLLSFSLEGFPYMASNSQVCPMLKILRQLFVDNMPCLNRAKLQKCHVAADKMSSNFVLLKKLVILDIEFFCS